VGAQEPLAAGSEDGVAPLLNARQERRLGDPVEKEAVAVGTQAEVVAARDSSLTEPELGIPAA
jgi:hypothetical protein